MVEIPEAIKKRFKKSVGKAQHKIEKLKNEFTDGNEEVLNVFKYIVSNVFGFNEQKESIRLPIGGMAYSNGLLKLMAFYGIYTAISVNNLMNMKKCAL